MNAPASPRKYFLLAQYARHIRSGMTLLETGETNTVGAYDPKARKVVIVALKDGEAREFVFDLSRFAGVDGPIHVVGCLLETVLAIFKKGRPIFPIPTTEVWGSAFSDLLREACQECVKEKWKPLARGRKGDNVRGCLS